MKSSTPSLLTCSSWLKTVNSARVAVTASSGGNSQNFLRKFVIFFVTFRCFNKAITHRKSVIYVFIVANRNFYWYLLQKLLIVIIISIFKSPNLQKKIKNLRKKFCEFQPRDRIIIGLKDNETINKLLKRPGIKSKSLSYIITRLQVSISSAFLRTNYSYEHHFDSFSSYVLALTIVQKHIRT